MTFGTIRQAIIDKINADSTKIQEAYRAPRSEFSGYPAVVVSPSENLNDYGSTAQDKLTYVFNLTAYYPVASEAEAETADAAMDEVVDELLDIFKLRNALSAASVDWLAPSPSTWGFVEFDGGGTFSLSSRNIQCFRQAGARAHPTIAD